MARYLVLLLTFVVVNCSDNTSPFELVAEYTKSHNPLQRPVSDQSTILDIKVSLNLLHIQNLDETRQQLTTTSWLYFSWTVGELVWDETKFQNISRVHAKPSDIYLPDLVISNAVDNYGQLNGGDLPVTIWSNGMVEWYAGNLLTTSCKVDVTRFPFDHQRCSIHLAQWFTFSSEVNYEFHDRPFTFLMFEENGEWQLLDYSTHMEYKNNGTYQILVFELFLGRRQTYYILTAVTPAFVLSALNLLVFHVPPGSGEKLTLCVSILLSYAVHLTSINSLLPSVSDHVAVFSIYLNCMFVLKALTVAASVTVLYLHSSPPTSNIRSFLTKHRSPNDSALRQHVLKEGEKNGSSEEEDQWHMVVKKTDRIFFYVFLSIFLTCSVGFLMACIL